MKINKNDPRLTSYLLNELSDSDKNLIEKALAEDSELRNELNQLKQSVLSLQKNNMNDADFRLTDKQRGEIFTRIATKKKSFSVWQFGFGGGGLIAAGLALLVFTHSLKEEVSRPIHEDIATVSKSAPVESESAILAKEGSRVRPVDSQRMKKEIPMHDSGAQALGALGSSGSAAKDKDSFAEKASAAPQAEQEYAVAADMAADEAPPVVAAPSAVAKRAAPAKSKLSDSFAREAKTINSISKTFQLISAKPELSTSLFPEVQKQFDLCLQNQISSDSFGIIEISWQSETQKLEVSSSRNSAVVTKSVQACLSTYFKSNSWPKSGLIVFKLQIVSKSNTEK